MCDEIIARSEIPKTFLWTTKQWLWANLYCIRCMWLVKVVHFFITTCINSSLLQFRKRIRNVCWKVLFQRVSALICMPIFGPIVWFIISRLVVLYEQPWDFFGLVFITILSFHAEIQLAIYSCKNCRTNFYKLHTPIRMALYITQANPNGFVNIGLCIK